MLNLFKGLFVLLSLEQISVFQGTIGDVFFIIRDGEVRITNDNPNGTEKEVARLGKSQYFGEAALIKVATALSVLSFHLILGGSP